MDEKNIKKDIYITKQDHDRLMTLMNKIPFHSELRSRIKDLHQELERAIVVEPTEIPKDVVTMNSHVDLENVDNGQKQTLHLVYPDEANISAQKISIFSPIGTAIIGYKIGDIIEWTVPAGIKKFMIRGIHYQPEASGDFDL